MQQSNIDAWVERTITEIEKERSKGFYISEKTLKPYSEENVQKADALKEALLAKGYDVRVTTASNYSNFYFRFEGSVTISFIWLERERYLHRLL